MAIFSCSISVVSRSKGRQVCASVAYQARETVFDIRQNLKFTYQDRSGEELLAKETMMPDGVPQWDRSTLWNAVEKIERRKDAQTARAIRLALPRELHLEQMLVLIKNFLLTQFLERGLASDFAIHNKIASDGDHQPHVHILVTTRALSSRGWAPKKDRKTLCSPRDVRRFRADWAAAVNAALLAAGLGAEVDHRSLSDQRREIQEFLNSDLPDRESRQILKAALHGLSRKPEGKARRHEWQSARRNGELPTSIALVRTARDIALSEADELLVLSSERDRLASELNGDSILSSKEAGAFDPAPQPETPEESLQCVEGFSAETHETIDEDTDFIEEPDDSYIELPFALTDDI
jgi:ATP-dependent exoDNAse (exonuclease V) alpha subunit